MGTVVSVNAALLYLLVRDWQVVENDSMAHLLVLILLETLAIAIALAGYSRLAEA